MKINSNMLAKWLDIPKNIHEMTNQKIVEVESFKPINTATDLVVGRVLTCEKHPNADNLSLTTVDLGDRVEQIVCGAPNVRKDQYVIVAQVGTVLPGNFAIKAAKIRGETSHGMICSLNELGIDERYVPEVYRDGIFYFEEPQKIGKPALPTLGLSGWIMELGLTPNRSDLLSVLGFAYDLAAMTNQKIELEEPEISESESKNSLKISIETDGCGRYYGRTFKDIQIKESPWWLKSALLSVGIQPINNVVDISNYVLIEYGTPLHMFDAHKVKTDRIVVRDAEAGESVVTLDDQRRQLEAGDVVITNGLEPIAIGGVMGLANTMIDEHTTSVILEAAYFDPKRIQRTTKRLDLKSDSSLRFERGIDDKRVFYGLERATKLLIDLADAKVDQGIVKAIRFENENPTIEIPRNYFNDALGLELKDTDVLTYLKRYNYDVKTTKEKWIVQAPSYRNDIQIPADVLEEIARIYGLDAIPNRSASGIQQGKLSFAQKRLRGLRHALADLGLNEIMTYSLIKESDVHLFQNIGKPVSVLKPMSEDKKTLRQSLIHGLVETIRYNRSRKIDDVHLFEIGHCFAKGYEKNHLGIALSGKLHKHTWKNTALVADFHLLKGLVERIFSPLGIDFSYEATDHPSFHPYQQAKIRHQGSELGVIARLHPRLEKELDLPTTVVFTIELDTLLEWKKTINYRMVSRYPMVSRDLAIVIDRDIEANMILDLIEQTGKPALKTVEIFDVYQGKGIDDDKKSLAFRLVFSDETKTMESDDVDKLMKRITKRLAYEVSATVRS
jgi:phenylalanyl-tRNA synthetase beta chain